MDEFQLLPTIITCAIQIITCGLTYLFGRRSARIDAKKAVLRERYDKFYIPFVRFLYKGFLIENVNSNMTAQNRNMIFDLLSNNLEYLDTDTLSLYPRLYKAFLDMCEYEDGRKGYDDAPVIFNQIINEVALTVLSETQRISKELQLPPLGQPLMHNYFHNSPMI